MKKYKVRILTLITLFALVLSAAFLAMPKKGALAAESYSASSVFTASSGAEVGVSEGETQYVQFKLNENGSVNYRHDLALKWFEKGATAAEGVRKYFSTQFVLPEVNFATLTLKFESAQENITKDGTTKNEITFAPVDGVTDKLTACVNGSDTKTQVTFDADKQITLAFVGDTNGDFDLTVNGTPMADKFTNIGGYYMEYLSSESSTPRIPMSFAATFKEDATTKTQLMQMRSLNGQSFTLTEGQVKDSAAPVLVVNEKIRAFTLGQKFNLSYLAVDVLDDTVTITRNFAYRTAPEGGAEETAIDALEYTRTFSTETYLVGQASGSEKEYVSMRFSLADDRTLTEDEKKAEYIYLAWYCEGTGHSTDDTLLTKGYIPVLRDEEGVSYTCVETSGTTSTLDTDNQAYKDYQAEVTARSENVKVGSGAYFYMPSLRELFKDTYTDYNNMKFTVYYSVKGGTQQSATSLKYNALRFEVKNEGEYIFRVVATDALGNEMKVYNQNGELVKITSENVWDLDCVPQFRFTATYTGAEIEQPKEQSIGYIDSEYSISSFDITAMDGYRVDYELYYFDQTAYMADNSSVPSYASMVADPAQIAEAGEGKYLKKIQEYDESITEDDEDEWEASDNEIEWKSSALTFRPQTAGYYFVKATVTDKQIPTVKPVAYQVIEVQNEIDVIESETYWLQNNVTAVVLFAISGLLLVAIIVLWLVKPSDKKVEEVELSELKGQKKDKKNQK